MSTLEEMKQQLAFLQEELKRHPKPKYWMTTLVDLENAIWTLQKRIREAELLEVAKKVDEDIEKSLQRSKVTGVYDTKEQG